MWFVLIFLLVVSVYVPYFGCMAWYLFTLKPVLAAAVPIVFLPTALTQILRTKVFAKLEDKSAPVRREYDYYEGCMVGRGTFKETRQLGAYGYFREKYAGALKLLNRLRYRAVARANLFELSMKILTAAGYAGILLMLFQALMAGEITVGAFAAVFTSIGTMYGLMEEVVCRHVGGMAQNMGTIRNYLAFLHLPERGGEPVDIPEGDIRLERVSFAYPGADSPAVRDVTLTLRRGETLAIVGENGSGKSTLVRLITGLYWPDSGEVTVSGVSTRVADAVSLHAGMSAVFQRYQRYQLTLRENIAVSRPGSPPPQEQLDAVCALAGLDLTGGEYPQGYDTMLSREFDGVDLSGGQWQRVAIARGYCRSHFLIVLDEPTAAIDPLEETRVYERFARVARDKTAVIVTHRLGSVRLADRILVMKEGRAAETGTHEELLAAGGEYARLYASQAQWYR